MASLPNQQGSKAIAPYERLKTMVKTDDVIGRFGQILGPARARQFLASVLNLVSTDTNLIDADPGSVLQSAMTAALFDLPVDKNLGFAWIIGYRDNTGRKMAQFQMAAKGYTQLALRSSMYRIINYALIYEGETVNVDKLTGVVSVQGEPVSKTVKGYVSYFELHNGYSHFMYWTVEEMDAHARKYSKSYSKPSSPWKTEFDKMGLKTILSNNLRKFGVLSITMQAAMDKDEDVSLDNFFAKREAQQEQMGDMIDGTFSEVPPFDAAEFLMAQGISKNEHAARGLLKRIPESVVGDPDALLIWGRAYRERRDAGDEVEAAAMFASTLTDLGEGDQVQS